MKRIIVVATAAVLAAVYCLPALAQDRGNWLASSSTARAITGDIAISDSKLTINFDRFTIAQIQRLNPNETSAVFAGEAGGAGNLYRLSVPGTKRFLHHNTLCGSDETQWMITSVTGNMLQVAFFSGTKMPVFTPEAIANSTDLCGTFSYVR
jgi:hypothetical protein